MIPSKKNFLINVSTYQRLIFLLSFLLLPVAGNAQWGATVPNPIMEYHYTYDNNGNITKIEDKVHGTGYNQDFTYDEVDRLSSAIGPYGNQNYTYDSVGNTLDITPPVTNTYDNGNIIDYNGKHIDYDYENRPVKITNSNNNTVTEFAYDYSGQRVYTKVSSGTITSEDYYVGNIYEEKYSVDSSNPISASTSTVTYVYAGSIRVAGLTIQTTATGTENNTLYYHGDHLGSSSIITDGSGTVVRNISYQPWGNVQSNTEESGANTLDPNHKFTGQILDESTDLYYYGARYYDPQLRRFISPDTIVQDYYNPQDLNRYSYAWNNPLRITDPTGHLENSQLTSRDYLYNKLYLWNQNPYFSATATFSQAFLTAPFTMPYRLGYSTGELIDSLFNSPASWMARGDTPPSIVSMKNEFNAGNPNPAIRALGTVAGDFVASYIAGKALSAPRNDFAYYMNKVESLDVSTQSNKAVFYSGPGNKQIAETFAERTGRTTLEMTPGGKWLEAESLYGRNSLLTKTQADLVWGKASQRFAENALGEVTIFNKGYSPISIYNLIENPALMKNPDVYKYIYRGY